MQNPRSIASRSSFAHLALALALLGIGLTLFTLVLYGVLNARSEAAASLKSLSTQMAQAQDLQTAARAANATKEERTALAALPLPQNGGADFIAKVESLAKTARVDATVSAITGTAPSGGRPGALSLTVHFSGSYAACLRYLKLIETMPAAVSIANASLDYNEADKSWGGLFTLSVLSLDTSIQAQ